VEPSVATCNLTPSPSIADMVRSREAGGFGRWLKESLSCGVKGFENFAMGLKREQPAVEAALSLPYSNEQTEG
jgi:transposase